MSNLSGLFPDGPRAARTTVVDDHHTLNRLQRLFGSPSDASRRELVHTDLPALMETVAAARKDAAPHPMPKATAARRGRRQRVRIDPLNLTVGAIAVLAVVSLAVFGGAQLANANPAASALRGLEAGEAQLENSADAVRGAHDNLTKLLADAQRDAAEYRTLLDSTAPVVDIDGNDIDIVDSTARAAAITEADAYIAALGAFEVPALPADYERGRIDEHSLDAIADAVDNTQTQLTAWAAAKPAVDEARAQLQPLIDAHETKRLAFASAFDTAAAPVTGQFDDRPQELLDAVTETAADVAASKLTTGAALAAYRAAATALVAAEPVVIPPVAPVVPSPVTPAPDDGEATDPPTTPTDPPAPPATEPPDPPAPDPDPTPAP